MFEDQSKLNNGNKPGFQYFLAVKQNFGKFVFIYFFGYFSPSAVSPTDMESQIYTDVVMGILFFLIYATNDFISR